MSLAHEPSWRLGDAVRATVVYADLFGFALSENEVYRDLVGVRTTTFDVASAVRLAVGAGDLVLKHGYVTLADRENLVEIRLARNDIGRRWWPKARYFGLLLSSLPYVRLVGVTGSLAANNATADADIDYILIAAPERLWLVRALAIAVVRLARTSGVTLCPNLLLTTNALALPHQDLYTAHELLQMVPLCGSDVYAELRAQNHWADRILPNRSSLAQTVPPLAQLAKKIKSAGEIGFGGSLGTRIDRWESRRKIARFRAAGTQGRFNRDVCEGHYGNHRDNILREWRRRCTQIGVVVPALLTEPGSDAAFVTANSRGFA
jgi:hypothetical protein